MRLMNIHMTTQEKAGLQVIKKGRRELIGRQKKLIVKEQNMVKEVKMAVSKEAVRSTAKLERQRTRRVEEVEESFQIEK